MNRCFNTAVLFSLRDVCLENSAYNGIQFVPLKNAVFFTMSMFVRSPQVALQIRSYDVRRRVIEVKNILTGLAAVWLQFTNNCSMNHNNNNSSFFPSFSVFAVILRGWVMCVNPLLTKPIYGTQLTTIPLIFSSKHWYKIMYQHTQWFVSVTSLWRTPSQEQFGFPQKL